MLAKWPCPAFPTAKNKKGPRCRSVVLLGIGLINEQAVVVSVGEKGVGTQEGATNI